jgi:Arc/MetJ-type ribon-helix-helix transcriptional regulator
MTDRQRITIQLEPNQKQQIERFVKNEYPRVKTISEVVRAALDDFLDKGSNQTGQTKVSM